MKVLHTADWHLGKSLCGRLRLREQSEALEQLFQAVRHEGIDAVIVCGDVFDTFVPKAEAEELFFRYMAKIGALCPVICFAGNHDDGERLQAAAPISSACGIHLVGDMKNDGFFSLKTGADTLNVGVLPYPFTSRILTLAEGETSTEKVTRLIDRCTTRFGSGVNIFASHLFIGDCLAGDERELGTSPILSRDILPKCDYVALGHIHKPQGLFKNRHAYYSGSLLGYSFDESSAKEFKIFDSNTGQVTSLPITAGRRLITAQTHTGEEAVEVCQANPDAYVKIVYDGDPLKVSDMRALKATNSFTDIKIIQHMRKDDEIMRADRPPCELFKAFYEAQKGKKPDKDLVELFLSLLN